jgi:hypothetical protein
VIGRLPKPIRQPLEALRTLWRVGAFARPLEALEQFRHRHQFMRLQKSLFYHRYASALLLAHELGIFDRLAERARTPAELADGTLNPNGADALLRVLEAEGLLARDGDGRFALTRFAALYLPRGGRHSLGGMLDLMSASASAFAELPRCLAGDETPAALDILSDGSRYRAFLGAVNEYLDAAGRDLLATIDLGEVRSLIVGSMGVSFSALVLQRHPEARVTYGCLEHLTREIPRLRQRFAVPPECVTGMHAHGGDPFADRWGDESFDLVFLTKKMILQPSERLGEKFARKAFQVLNPGGTAIFWETVHTDDAPTPIARAMEAVLDLFTSPAGLVNTESGLRALFLSIGFHGIDVVPCLGGQTTFVVARKPR